MTTVASPTSISPSRAPAVASPIVEDRVLLHNISWETYELLLRDLENSHVRLTYDQGDLEIMSPSPKHERVGKFLGRMVEQFTVELNIPLVGFGRATWRNQTLAKGLEADESYYIPRAAWASSREEIDLTIDPPPDLAIEVDVTHPTIDKLAVYAALKVPEVWRYEDPTLFVLHLQPSGMYEPRPRSLALPMLEPQVLESFIKRRNTADDTAIMREFRDWVRANLLQS